MSVVVPRSLRLSLNLDQQIEAAFATLIHEPWGRAEPLRVWQPAVDLFESDNSYLIEADLPGVAREDIEVRLEDRQVVLRGRRQSVRVCRSQRGVRVERAQGDFERAIFLEQAIDPDRAEIHFEQGILRVELIKRRPLRPLV